MEFGIAGAFVAACAYGAWWWWSNVYSLRDRRRPEDIGDWQDDDET